MIVTMNSNNKNGLISGISNNDPCSCPNMCNESTLLQYKEYIPTKSVQAIKEAVSNFYSSEDFSVGGILGKGYFATVILVRHIPSKEFMAMKVCHRSATQHHEIEILNSLSHNKILKMYGASVVAGRLACLTEYAAGGSMNGLLKNKIDLSWNLRISLAYDIAKGLQYLHSQSLIHRDLSSQVRLIHLYAQNILIRFKNPAFIDKNLSNFNSWQKLDQISSMFRYEDFETGRRPEPCKMPRYDRRPSCVKEELQRLNELYTLPELSPLLSNSFEFLQLEAVVADVGLVLDFSKENADLTEVLGNPYYIAPECLSRIAPYSTAADIFGFGLLVCELLSNMVNDGQKIPRTKEFGLDSCNLPVLPGCPAWFLDMAKSCCIVHPIDRIRMPQILSLFQLHHHQPSDPSPTHRPSSSGSPPTTLTVPLPMDNQDHVSRLPHLLTTPVSSTDSNQVMKDVTSELQLLHHGEDKSELSAAVSPVDETSNGTNLLLPSSKPPPTSQSGPTTTTNNNWSNSGLASQLIDSLAVKEFKSWPLGSKSTTTSVSAKSDLELTRSIAPTSQSTTDDPGSSQCDFSDIPNPLPRPSPTTIDSSCLSSAPTSQSSSRKSLLQSFLEKLQCFPSRWSTHSRSPHKITTSIVNTSDDSSAESHNDSETSSTAMLSPVEACLPFTAKRPSTVAPKDCHLVRKDLAT